MAASLPPWALFFLPPHGRALVSKPYSSSYIFLPPLTISTISIISALSTSAVYQLLPSRLLALVKTHKAFIPR